MNNKYQPVGIFHGRGGIKHDALSREYQYNDGTKGHMKGAVHYSQSSLRFPG